MSDATTKPTPAADAKLATDMRTARESVERGDHLRPRRGALVVDEIGRIMRVKHADGDAFICRVIYDANGPTDGEADGAIPAETGELTLLAQADGMLQRRHNRLLAIEHRGDRITVYHVHDFDIDHGGLVLTLAPRWDTFDGEDARRGKFSTARPDDVVLLNTIGVVRIPERMMPPAPTLPADLSDEPADEWVDEDPHDLSTPVGRADEASAILEMFQQLQRRLERIDHDDARAAMECHDIANHVETLALNTRTAAMDAELAERFPDRQTDTTTPTAGDVVADDREVA
ncbi:MAG: hypothetical protein AAGD32_06150 [Planctomycetota bacterium]